MRRAFSLTHSDVIRDRLFSWLFAVGSERPRSSAPLCSPLERRFYAQIWEESLRKERTRCLSFVVLPLGQYLAGRVASEQVELRRCREEGGRVVMVGAAHVPRHLSSALVLSGLQDLHVRVHRSILWRLTLGMCWHVIHVLVSTVHFGLYLLQLLHCFLISSGVLQKYRVLPLHKLRYLAIVVDSEEAKDTLKIKNLLQCLSNIGVKHVILYDIEGVLKRSEASLRKWTSSSVTFYEHDIHTSTPLFDHEKMSLEVLSSSDGKEAVAKAANFVCSKYLKEDNLVGDRREPVFTETDMADALITVGCGGPEPDLLLVFSPIRCHLGFPAWRMRYTEIVHMGTLKSMKYGAVQRAIYDLSRKHQNYGS